MPVTEEGQKEFKTLVGGEGRKTKRETRKMKTIPMMQMIKRTPREILTPYRRPSKEENKTVNGPEGGY